MIACLPRLFAWSKDKENNAFLKKQTNKQINNNKKQKLLHNNGMNSDVVKSNRKKKDTDNVQVILWVSLECFEFSIKK